MGYGAEKMISGHEDLNLYPGFKRYNQYYLALDINVGKIKTKKAWLNTLLGYMNMIKVPLPTLEYSNESFKFYPFYF